MKVATRGGRRRRRAFNPVKKGRAARCGAEWASNEPGAPALVAGGIGWSAPITARRGRGRPPPTPRPRPGRKRRGKKQHAAASLRFLLGRGLGVGGSLIGLGARDDALHHRLATGEVSFAPARSSLKAATRGGGAAARLQPRKIRGAAARAGRNSRPAAPEVADRSGVGACPKAGGAGDGPQPRPRSPARSQRRRKSSRQEGAPGRRPLL